MKQIKKFIKDNLAIIVFALSFILDAQYQILEHFITDPFWLNLVKGLGAVLLAYFTKEKLGTSNAKRDAYLDGEYTAEQQDAVNECVVILYAVGLELVGTRPKDR